MRSSVVGASLRPPGTPVVEPGRPPVAASILSPLPGPTVPATTPTQRRVVRELFGRGRVRPSFDEGLGPRLRAILEEGIEPFVAGRRSGEPLFVGKQALAQVQACEGWAAAERCAPFAWSAAAATGTVAHKAVELSFTLRSTAPPLELVDLAIDRLIDSTDKGIRTWLLDAPAAELAELRGAAADWLVKFEDTFPPLRAAWRPRLESALTVELCGRRVVLRGKVDLALGRAEGTTARVLIVDFKTGTPRATHADDLRFYALLETIRVGVPPYRLATFSLDSGTWCAEEVDERLLAAAARRAVDGAARLARLADGRRAALRAGTACRWCPAATTCPATRAEVAS